MRSTIAVLATLFVLIPLAPKAHGDVSVRGYYRRNGTYVQPYHRSSPDHSYNDNWSTAPNVDPYTGNEGTRQPTWNDRPPTDNSVDSGNAASPNYGSDPYGGSGRSTGANTYDPYQR